jgi:hypothetical protein
MRIRLSERFPYTPRDLAGRYDPEGVLHVYAKCDDQLEASTMHAMLTGGNNAQQQSTSLQWRSQALRRLWRKIRPHPALLLPNRALLEEVR